MSGVNIREFMNREFGEEGKKILDEILEELHVSDVKDLDLDGKREFVAAMIPVFRSKKQGRSGVLTSELMSVIGLQVQGQSGITPQFDREVMRSYIGVEGEMRLKVINAKIEAMYGLFWQKAAKAFKMGMDVGSIEKITGRTLLTVKQDLYAIVGELEERFNLNTVQSKMRGAKVKSRRDDFTFYTKHLSARQRTEKLIEPLFLDFKHAIDENYAAFYNVFMGSIKRDIELRNQGKFDTELINKAQMETRDIWDKILLAYDILRSEVEKIPSVDEMEASEDKTEEPES